MFCKKCGQEIKDGYKFCSKCGCPIGETKQEINQVNNKNKPKRKNPIKKIMLVIVFFIIIGAGTYFSMNYIKLEKYKNNFTTSVSSYEMEEYNQILDEFEKNWELYKFFEFEKKDRVLNKFQESFENLLDESKKEAEEKINDYEKTINNISKIEAEDKESCQNMISKAKELVDGNKYKELEQIYINLDNIIKSYDNKNGILKLSLQQIDTSSYPNIKLYLKVEDRDTKEIPENLDINCFYLSKKENFNYINHKIEKVSIYEDGVYIIEFLDNDTNITTISDILLEYKSDLYNGELYCNYKVDSDNNINDKTDTVYSSDSDPKLTVEGYIKGFDDAMTKGDFSYISSYLKPGSSIYNMQKKQVLKNIQETLESYEILSLNYINQQNCIIETREVYYVKSEDNKTNIVKQECKYNLEYIDGKWFMTDFVEPVKFID